MPEPLYALAVLGCPVGMGLMWMMMRGNHQQKPTAAESEADQAAELARLRHEVDRLRAGGRHTIAHPPVAANGETATGSTATSPPNRAGTCRRSDAFSDT